MQPTGEQLDYLDFAALGFSTRSATVLQARDCNWCARTPYGLAVLRHREVGLLLRDKRLRQGSYDWSRINGLSGSFSDFWSRSIISQEGDVHRALRQIATSALSPDYIQGLIPQFDHSAEMLAEKIVKQGECDFMAEFAVPFAGQAICIILGMDIEDWERVSYDASDLGLALGVDCKNHESRFNVSYDRLAALANELIDKARSKPAANNLVSRLVENFDAAELQDPQQLQDLVVISIFGGVDTIKSQLGFVVSLLVEHPDQWKFLRQDPDLVGNAIEESIRLRPTTTWATREAIDDFEFQGQAIKRGEKLHMMVHASACDPEICDEQTFDIQASRKIHFGFGGGAHHCIGHLAARTDMASALKALVKKDVDLSYSSLPTWLPETGNTSPTTLPLRIG